MSNQLIKTTGLGKENVFPRTRILDLFDATSGLKLIDILKSFNMMFVPYLGNKSYTRNQISPELRRQGLWLTYVIDNAVYTEWYDEVAIDDTNWGSDSNWRQGSNALVGDLSISPNGTWVINGEDSGISIKGDKGDSPVIRIYNNRILVSYDKGITYEDLNNTPIYTTFRTEGNRLQVSTDLGTTWEDCSEPIAAWFRWTDVSGTGNVGKVQMSRDLQNWLDLSPTMTNNLYIKGYVATVEELPTDSAAIGDIYMVGPTYDESDTTLDYPHYRMWVKLSSGWIDNGEYLSNVLISLTTGLETGITMSLKAITNTIVAEKNRAEAAEQANAQAIAEEKVAIMGTDRIADGAVTYDKLQSEIKEVVEGVTYTENPEFISVKTDADGRILSSIDKDNNKKENLHTEFTKSLRVKGKEVLTEHQDISHLANKLEVDKIKEEVSSIVLIGDSISSFKDYIPADFRYYYPTGDITEVSQTYWWKFANKFNVEIQNLSYSGSTASNNECSLYSRVNRANKSSIYIIALGTNDSLRGISLGDYDYDLPVEELDESKFIPAYIKGIKALREKNINAKFILVAMAMSDSYSDAIKAIAEHYDALYFDARGSYNTQNIHPDATEMEKIAMDMISYTCSKISETSTRVEELGRYRYSSEYVKALIDSDERLLLGITHEGDIVFGAGIPRQIKAKFNDVETRIPQDSDNDEFAQLTTDKDGRLLDSIRNDGTREFYSPKISNVVKEEFRYDTKEWLYVVLDANDRILYGVRVDGEFIDSRNTNKSTNENAPIPMIFDTDWGGDPDDAMAVRLLGYFARHHYVKPILISFVNGKSPNGISGLNAQFEYEGMNDIPILAQYDIEDGHKASNYDTSASLFYHSKSEADCIGISLYRKTLANLDRKCIICITGTTENISALLNSSGDEYSPLTGIELVHQKVEKIYVMGGQYIAGEYRSEYNFTQHPEDTKNFFAKCTVPMILCGYEIAGRSGIMLGGGCQSELPDYDILRKELEESANIFGSTLLSNGREGHDPVATLCACLGSAEKAGFSLERGIVDLDERAWTKFTKNSKGNHYVMVKRYNNEYYRDYINRILFYKVF